MERESTDPREPVPGPGDTELAPAGNSDARFVVPGDQEKEREERDLEEPEEGASADEDD